MTASRSDRTADERAVERMLGIGLTMREELAERSPTDWPTSWLSMMLDFETGLVESPSELRLACDRLRQRGDADALALSAYAATLLNGKP